MATTGLDLCQDLPSLMRSLPSIKIQTPKAPQPQQQADDAAVPQDDEECCRTPKSESSKIPAVFTCPPAPRRAAGSCKRKLTELQFFEVVNRDEVDAFFGSTGLFNKRSCPCK